MINLENYLYDKVKPIIAQWDEPGIYAISFFVYSNEGIVYRDVSNVSEFEISYNTEKFCTQFAHDKRHCPLEERWNFACWSQDTTPIIKAEDDDEGMATLFAWYRENGIENIGAEDYNAKPYIGPVGFIELLTAAANVARRLQEEGFIADKFGQIPIIVHDLEYGDYVLQATAHANPNEQAYEFLAWMDKMHADAQEMTEMLKRLTPDELMQALKQKFGLGD